MNLETFMAEILRLIGEAKDKGLEYTDIVSGDVHRKVGGYPSRDHRMATCCEVMYSIKKQKDEVLYAPPKRKGATLKIRYYL